MTRIPNAAASALLLLAFAPDTSAQVLRRDIVTTSTRTGVSLHTEHARPIAYRPYMLSGDARLACRIDYVVEATNLSAVEQTVFPQMFRTDAFVTNTICWGSDPSSGSTPFGVGQSFDIPANSTRILSGVDALGSSDFIPGGLFTGACSGMDDGLHRPSGTSLIYAGPTSQFGWWASTSVVTYADAGTTFTNDLTVTTTYEFPEISAGSVCDPLAANSTGSAGSLTAYGDAALDGFVILQAESLPANAFTLVAFSDSLQPPAPIGFGQATLCLGGTVYRWLDSVGLTDANGAFEVEGHFADLPAPVGAFTPGSTWSFQVFHRDTIGGAASANSTSAVSITF